MQGKAFHDYPDFLSSSPLKNDGVPRKGYPIILGKESIDIERKESSYTVRLGNTSFIVCAKQSETAKKPIETVFRDLCVHEVLGSQFVMERYDLEKTQKSS